MTNGCATVVITAVGFSNIVFLFFSYIYIYIYFFCSVSVTVAVSIAVTLATMTLVLLLLVCGIRRGVIPILAVLPTYAAASHQRRPTQENGSESCGVDDDRQIQAVRSRNTLINARTRSPELGRNDIELGHCSTMYDETASDRRTKPSDGVVCDTDVKTDGRVGGDIECSTTHDGEGGDAHVETDAGEGDDASIKTDDGAGGDSLGAIDDTEVRVKKNVNCEKCDGLLKKGKIVHRLCTCGAD